MEQSRTLPLHARPDTFAGTDKLVEKVALRKNQRSAVGLASAVVHAEIIIDPIDDIPKNIILAEE